MKSKEYIVDGGARIFLGRNSKNNDELVLSFKDKENVIFHTEKPGSPFCVIEKLKPSKHEIKQAALMCASKSQDWRDNHKDVKMHQFTGKDVKKGLITKEGTWKLKKKPKSLILKKIEIEKWIKETK
jgi:predicted ribosome quality control (RQC) complex YloA/Tae2 family protein